MNRLSSQQGLTLLVLLVLLVLGGFALAQVSNAGYLQQKLKLQQHARESQILDHIRTGLLGFAGNQGIHSQSHLGHLPCPAIQAGGIPATTCLNKPWGFLPVQSKTAVNYLNQGIDARQNELEPSTRHHWHYAVSAQLIQPNALGWSRWVDYTQPAIQIEIPAENNRVETQIAGVVAHQLEPIGKHQYRVTPPYALIRVSELRAHMASIQTGLIKQTLKTWQETKSSPILELADHENLQLANASTNTYSAIDSQCSCRCTKTRCNCNCGMPAQWQSAGTCVGSNANCNEQENQSICTSDVHAPCVFAGPSWLKNEWPVGRFEPVAAANKSCRPSVINQCPLSTGSDACTCDFSWPDNTKSNLGDYTISLSPTDQFQVAPRQP
ncbi:hypothetical protein [Limnobacter parvus]|uniref:Type 4 fimbrial biogenesis protein PilX N-terminal domain-containing protein n=1 Tax=Limnobacter parvus TaxID=2939690 RepID=A0ABT1XCY9_9BURK|nr:hypothetical protein [Limnobacter parvus]MCR2745147.1 hypothetical protein [Limnobacter parvus]